MASAHHARPVEEHGVRFHFFRYAPLPVAERVRLRGGAARRRARCAARRGSRRRWRWRAGWFKAMRVAQKHRATVMHGHWVVPGGVIALAARAGAAAGRQPARIGRLRRRDVRAGARRGRAPVFARAGAVTACSADLARRAIALGADRRDDRGRALRRRRGALPAAARARAPRSARRSASPDGAPLGLHRRTAGPEEGVRVPDRRAGAGRDRARRDPGDRRRRRSARGAARAGPRRRASPTASASSAICRRTTSARIVGAADVVVVPSVRDDSGNVDGLPNIVLEALAVGRRRWWPRRPAASAPWSSTSGPD